MKRILLLIGCLPFLLASCRQEKTATTLRFNVSDYDGNAPRVIIGWDNQSVAIDSAGKGALSLNLKAPTYATVEVRKYDRRLCYLEPGKDLILTYSMKKGEKALTFDGALAPENRFIYQNDYLPYRLDYQERNPQKNVRTIDSVLAVNLQKVAESDQSATFKEWESKRVQVEALNALMRVPLMNAPDHVKLLTERINRDSTYLSIPAYREALDQYIRKCVSADRQGGRIPEGAGLADIRMKYILKNISEPAARSYLVDITLFHFGEQGIERYDRLYNQYVTDPERLALYAEACKKAERIAPGQPCPDFRFADNHGDTVTLADHLVRPLQRGDAQPLEIRGGVRRGGHPLRQPLHRPQQGHRPVEKDHRGDGTGRHPIAPGRELGVVEDIHARLHVRAPLRAARPGGQVHQLQHDPPLRQGDRREIQRIVEQRKMITP